MDDIDVAAERILTGYDTITVVGASRDPEKAAYRVPVLMQERGWKIVPVNPYADELYGEPVHRFVADVPGGPGLVDVFRPPQDAADVAGQAIDAGATALWLQLGITSEEARTLADDAGLLYVEDRCLIVEARRLGLDAPGR